MVCANVYGYEFVKEWVMSTESYLVALDGSKDALKASEVAWKLAKAKGAKLTALTVVDTQSIWDILGRGLSGLIGSGPYVTAFEAIQTSLRSVGEALLVSFEARSQGHQIDTNTIMEEGNLAERLLHHGESYNLVIMGRRGTISDGERSLVRTSLSEKVAAAAATPVLIVSSEPRLWKQARLVLDAQTYDKQLVLKFVQIAEDLQLEPEIFCTGDDASNDRLSKKLKDIIPHSVKIMSHDAEYGDEAWEEAVDVTSATLLAVATRQHAGKRSLANGPTIRDFVKSLPVISLLVFPPAPPKTNDEKSKQSVTAVRS